jgi:hypothetical protein
VASWAIVIAISEAEISVRRKNSASKTHVWSSSIHQAEYSGAAASNPNSVHIALDLLITPGIKFRYEVECLINFGSDGRTIFVRKHRDFNVASIVFAGNRKHKPVDQQTNFSVDRDWFLGSRNVIFIHFAGLSSTLSQFRVEHFIVLLSA